MSSLLRSSKTKLFSSSASLSRTFSSLPRSNHRLHSPPQIGALPSLFQLFHRNTTSTSHGDDNPSKGNSSDVVNPRGGEFGKPCDLPSMNDPFSKLGIGSNKIRPMVLMNTAAWDTMLAGAGYHTGSSKVWDAKGPMSLGVRSVDADTLGLTGHKRSMSDIASTISETKPYTFRPLSPHLPVYQPQLSSTLSIINRISGALLASVILLFYMIYMKMGLISLTYDSFYQFLFYSSKLNLLAIEISALALSYHLYMGIRHLVHLV